MLKAINIHYKNMSNIGDEMCSPARYFEIGRRVAATSKWPRAEYVIFGGGCITNKAITAAQQLKGKSGVILWGSGTTKRNRKKQPLHPDYSDFVLASSRDRDPPAGVDYVPCPSCMHPIFDEDFETTTKFVTYGHAKLSPMNSLNNNCMDFEKVIRHLASAETVITSSYHGMVWATWLGRKVHVYPFGAKFYGFPYEWGKQHSNSLREAREANLAYWEKVRKVIHGD